MPSTDRISTGQALVLGVGLLAALVSGVLAYRSGGRYAERFRDDPRVRTLYAPGTGDPRLLVFDADGDGLFDAFADLENGDVTRTAFDNDQDGVMDEWEYYGPDGAVVRVGFSTRGDGHEDAWRYLDAEGAVERVEYGPSSR